MNLSIARILFVDDDRDSCDLLEFMLSHTDDEFEVRSAATIAEASFLIAEQPFDLYIFDYALRDGTGTELCRQVRRTNRNVPVMFYSAMSRPVDLQTAKNAGANEYLIKPNDLERVLGTVTRLLDEVSSPMRPGFGLESLRKRAAQGMPPKIEGRNPCDRIF